MPAPAPVEIHVSRRGEGPEALLVHGGASPARTWAGLEPLADRWTLGYAFRRGYPPSPPGPLDFDLDARDLAPLLESRPHLVAHSYGGLGTLIAAAARPDRVRSLTLIEVPLYFLCLEDADVAHLRRISDEALRRGLRADPQALREFLRLAGAPDIDEGPIPEAAARGIRRAHGGRSPDEARPDLEILRRAGVPVMVASGGHHDAIERICDAAAAELDGERAIAPGAGHFVAAAPGFAERLRAFWEAVEGGED